MAKLRRAICAGTFDPFTNGHRQMIEPMLQVVDQVVLSIGTNPGKHPVFTLDERLDMLLQTSREYGDRVVLDQFPNEYQVDYAVSRGADFIFRGLRNADDFREEQHWVDFNYRKQPSVVQLFLITPDKYSGLSSSKVKSLAGEPNWEAKVKTLVPQVAYCMMLEKYHSPLAGLEEAGAEKNAIGARPRHVPLRGVYISRFDPFTNGHHWMIWRALEVVDELIIGVSNKPYANPTFSKPEIEKMLADELIKPFQDKATIAEYIEDHRVDFAARMGAQVIFRDIKREKEFLEEKEKVQHNYETHPEITQLFIIPPTEYSEQTSARVKKLIGFKGWQDEIARIVPPTVYYAIREKYDPEFRRLQESYK